MADKTYSAEYNITGNASDALRSISQEAGRAEGALDKAGESTKATKVETESFTDRLNKLKVAYAAVIQQAQAAVKEFAKQEAASGRLQRAFDKVGASQTDFNKAQAVFLDNRNKLGLAVDAQSDAYRQLLEVTGSTEMATRDLALAVDIASQENIGLEQATEALRKARNGEVEELKNLNGISKEYASQLAKMPGDAERGAAAIRELEKAYDGAAVANAGTEEAIAAFEEQLKSMQAETGEVVVALGNMIGKLAEAEAQITDTNAVTLENFSNGWADFTDQIVEAMGEVGKFTEEASALEIASAAAAGPAGLEMFVDVLDRAETAALKAKKQTRELRELMAGPGGILEVTGSARTTPQGASPALRAITQEQLDAEEGRKTRERKKREAEEARRESERREREAASLGESMAADVLGGAEQAMEQDRKNEALQEELRIRNEIAQLKLEGRDIDALILELENSKLTPLEQILRLETEIKRQNKEGKEAKEEEKDATEDTLSAKLKEHEAVVAASGQAASGIISSISESDEAKMASAALDAAVYGYKAVASYVENPAAAIAYSAAAVQALAVAAGSAGGGGAAGKGGKGGGAAGSGGGQARFQTDPEAAARRQARLFAEEFNREQARGNVTYNINYRSIARPTEQEARTLGESINRNAQTVVGGAGRTLNVGGG